MTPERRKEIEAELIPCPQTCQVYGHEAETCEGCIFTCEGGHSEAIKELLAEIDRLTAENSSMAAGNCPNIRHNDHANKYCALMGDRPIEEIIDHDAP